MRMSFPRKLRRRCASIVRVNELLAPIVALDAARERARLFTKNHPLRAVRRAEDNPGP
jgi:hypothetical protein